ncbi:MAG: ribosome biogenesis GTP-binding protein YihA/YsxC [Rickettsiaceae bacterium]
MFDNPKFLLSASDPKQIPKNPHVVDLVFIGKSNVGKSSLINALCNNGHLAKTSKTPGRTRQINFFSLATNVALVDLPGYGFANVPLDIKQKWEKLIIYYLSNTQNKKILNLLIDARRGLQKNDIAIIELLLSYRHDFHIVFTKIDKIPTADVDLLLNDAHCKLTGIFGSKVNLDLICVSVKNKSKIQSLKAYLSKAIRDTKA